MVAVHTGGVTGGVDHGERPVSVGAVVGGQHVHAEDPGQDRSEQHPAEQPPRRHPVLAQDYPPVPVHPASVPSTPADTRG